MKMHEKWNALIASLRGYDVAVSETAYKLTVTDRANGSEMIVFDESCRQSDNPSDIFTNIVVSFSTQHRHFEDVEDAVEYVLQILGDEVLPLEFYRDGERRFGGDIERSELPLLSQAVLSQRFMVPREQLVHFQFEIHSWSGKYDVPRTDVSHLP